MFTPLSASIFTLDLVTGLNTTISDVDYLLAEMANKNLDVHSQHEAAYVGRFQNILNSAVTKGVQSENHAAKTLLELDCPIKIIV